MALNPHRATYIDFESLQQDSPHPALLGALTAHFEQFVLDPALWRAAAAKGHCRAETLHDAIDELVERAEREDRAIVGWSLFERTVVEKSDLPTALKEAFVDRYVNGLALAKKWKSTLHPRVKLERDDSFDTRKRLDRFAALTEYPPLTALRGEPAKWVRRMKAQMTKVNGRYRRTSKGAKKVWHQLLA